MTLDTKFYSDNTSLAGRVDTTLIKLAGKAAEDYQAKTRKRYTELIKFMYKASAIIYTSGFVPPGIEAWFKIKEFEIESPIEEEQRLVKQGKSKNKGKIERTGLLLIPLLFGKMGEVILTNPNYQPHRIMAIPMLAGALGTLPYLFAEYLCKAKVDPLKK